ncbi:MULTISPECIES: RNA 2',3'-cyclic phosphodiesterase [Oceanobacillus]|uniref:RNA 2',3'-cyclic phosphodiesterase n=1 Tax=Oceanobacillus TaxID=182709 RepID=UPI001F0AAFCB|nr:MULTISPECIES: RNA 2',3'-cyclic phosphodiesterase [Oceanobacillus]
MEILAHYFIGIDLPNHVKQSLNDVQRKFPTSFSYRQWTHKSDLHITLTFLGELDDKQLTYIEYYLNKLKKRPFFLTMDQLGIFGNHEKPRVLWAGLKHSHDLHEIYRQISSMLTQMEFSIDTRPYRPHITLAKKWNDPSNYLDSKQFEMMQKNVQSIATSFEVDTIHLFKIFPQQMPKYQKYRSFPLRG